MGLLGNSTSLMRFLVQDDLPPDYQTAFGAGIMKNIFHELVEHSIDERSAGWVNVMEMFDNKFTGQEYLKDNYLTLSLRIDTRRVPAKALKIFSRREELEEMTRLGKEFLSKARKAEIRDRVQAQLLSRVIPACNTYDMIWSFKDKLVWFSSTSAAIADEFMELYKKSFGVRIIPVFPYTMALEHCRGLNKERLDRLEETDFC